MRFVWTQSATAPAIQFYADESNFESSHCDGVVRMKTRLYFCALCFLIIVGFKAYAQRIQFTIIGDMTLQDALHIIANRSGQPVYVSKQDLNVVRSYRFPPYMVGVRVNADTAGQALSFLFGVGWEGSPIQHELQAKLGEDYKLARTPPPIKIGNMTLWACNNRYFDWEPVGKGVRVIVRLQPDGDLLYRKPFELELVEDATIDLVRDLINQHIGIYFNIIPEGHKFMPSNLLPQYKRLKVREPFLVPMRVAQLSLLFGALIEEKRTLGEWLSMLAEGLNLHCRSRKCVWKWTAWIDEREKKPIYTLRCYAHPVIPQ